MANTTIGKKKATDKIMPERFYTLYEIYTCELIPEVRTLAQLKSRIYRDSVEKRILNPKTEQTSRGLRYQILGKDIILYKKAYEKSN